MVLLIRIDELMKEVCMLERQQYEEGFDEDRFVQIAVKLEEVAFIKESESFKESIKKSWPYY